MSVGVYDVGPGPLYRIVNAENILEDDAKPNTTIYISAGDTE